MINRLLLRISRISSKNTALEKGYFVLLASFVGIFVSIIAAVFRELLTRTDVFFLMQDSKLLGIPKAFAIPALPAIGGLVGGYIVYKLIRKPGLHGVPSVMKAVALRNLNLLHPHTALIALTSIFTIGSGGSAGPEGPIVEIGSVVGATVGKKTRISRERKGLLVGCGAAAGIAAMFNAPIGGVVFTLEIILRTFSIRAFAPVVISAVAASLLSRGYFGNYPPFYIERTLVFKYVSLRGLFFYALLGLFCALLSILFMNLLKRVQDVFQKIKIAPWLKPCLGGLLAGIIGIAAPDVLGEGYQAISENLRASLTVKWALALVFLKILATCLTLGSGAIGGVFAPSLFIGACAGGAMGSFFMHYTPNLVNTDAPILFALAGMGGMLAGTLTAPLTGILLIFEVTGGQYQMVLPLMFTVAISSIIARSLTKQSIYTMSLLRDGFNVENAALPNLLSLSTAAAVMHPPTKFLKETDTLPNILHHAAEVHDTIFPVEDKEGRFIGLITLNDLKSVLAIGDMGRIIIAADIADPLPRTLTPEDTLDKALNLMTETETEAVPIVSDRQPDKLLGIIRRQDIFAVYKKILEGQDTEIFLE
ncbi:MAG TPA: chloride channel protein [Candidatus Sumerlaeota bacterium]|nr:MAG: H(+)/Cl(-) exchange transporter ClcA [candidate division BRC1 bacterium ADurb.Bin183]HOE62684.1 chloride channel protein [Candidatus Sumerlaeota bacterium]HRR29990.1 chloride channel protein [Candidatus Sumerlaeia bacterium]HON49444.1 chloride channel protein [Candidatus Sumerlaeota bacterium]HOR64806.1 chloride channel protein [Candidatus Sumerlaeota bacterium]